MTDIELYNEALNFLLEHGHLKKEELDGYLHVENSRPDNLSSVFKRLCESAQSQQMNPKVIGASINGIENLKSVLFDFSPYKVANNYESKSYNELLRDIVKVLKPKGQIRETARSIWPKYCRTIIESAHFLSNFSSANDFYRWADSFLLDYRSKPALPLAISFEIKGIGFPLACDFLKELGYTEFGKPDVHLKEMFKAFKLIDAEEKSVDRQDYFTLKAIERIAKENEITSYAVDKIFWLIGSGNFYLTGKSIGRKKEKFINYIALKYKI